MNKTLIILTIFLLTIAGLFFGVDRYINYRTEQYMEAIGGLRIENDVLKAKLELADSTRSQILRQIEVSEDKIANIKKEMAKKKIDTLQLNDALRYLEEFK